MTKFKVGDKCRIVNYGHKIWTRNEDNSISVFDINPSLIGKEVTILLAERFQGQDKYSTDVFSWAKNDQLELI